VSAAVSSHLLDDREDPAQILIVDDDPITVVIAETTLQHAHHRAVGASTLDRARSALERVHFDLVLCDIMLERESGFDLLQNVCVPGADTAVVMLSAIDDPDVAQQADALGAHGYIVKPFTPRELVINVNFALRRLAVERERMRHLASLEAKVARHASWARRTVGMLDRSRDEALEARRETAHTLASALAMRDEDTGDHVERVGRSAVLLASLIGAQEWDPDDLRVGAMLHDLGKIAIPDAVLLKPGALTEEEMELCRRHAELGSRLLEGAASEALSLGASIALTHHERWDGTGYPRGLAGRAIPLEGRITAVADVFDALTSDRPYRDALTVEHAVTMMRAESGRHFDPSILAAFVDAIDEVVAIRAAVTLENR